MVNILSPMESQWSNCPTQVCMENCHWNGGGANCMYLCMFGVLRDGGGGHWLVRMEWRPAEWSACLPLLIFPCTIKSRSSLLALAHPGGPGKRAVKQLWCGMFWCVDWLSRDCWRSHSTASFYVRLWAEDGATRQALAISTLCCWTLWDDCFQGSFGILFWAFCQDFM